jgi:hypothetical protein
MLTDRPEEEDDEDEDEDDDDDEGRWGKIQGTFCVDSQICIARENAKLHSVPPPSPMNDRSLS